MVIQQFLTSPPCNVFGATYPMLDSLPFSRGMEIGHAYFAAFFVKLIRL